jgi:hypothetical protein
MSAVSLRKSVVPIDGVVINAKWQRMDHYLFDRYALRSFDIRHQINC